MSVAIQPTSFIPVKVTGDWTDATVVYDDITNALSESFPGLFGFPVTDALVITLLQKQSDYTDKCGISLGTDGTATISSAFSTTPEIDSYVYISDLY